MRTRHLPMVLLSALLIVLTPIHATAQAMPAALFVTYISATPQCACDTSVGKLEVVFRVVYSSCEPYCGFVSHPAVGIKYATFIIVSTETHQTKEHPNIPVYPGATEGEYRAVIQITPDDPTGHDWVYVKGGSLQLADGLKTGPPNNISSEQTEDTSDLSLVEIGKAPPQPSPPSPVTQLLQGNELVIILLAIIVILLVLLAIFARRKPKPTSLTLVREPYPERPGRRRPTSLRSRESIT